MVRKIIGWILLIWGGGGLLINIAAMMLERTYGMIWFNTLVCIVFIWVGGKLLKPKPKPVIRIRK